MNKSSDWTNQETFLVAQFLLNNSILMAWKLRAQKLSVNELADSLQEAMVSKTNNQELLVKNLLSLCIRRVNYQEIAEHLKTLT